MGLIPTKFKMGPMKPAIPTGQAAIDVLAAQYAKESKLDPDLVAAAFTQHLTHEDAAHMLENDDTTWDGETRYCRAIATAEQGHDTRRGAAMANHIRGKMAEFAQRK